MSCYSVRRPWGMEHYAPQTRDRLQPTATRYNTTFGDVERHRFTGPRRRWLGPGTACDPSRIIKSDPAGIKVCRAIRHDYQRAPYGMRAGYYRPVRRRPGDQRVGGISVRLAFASLPEVLAACTGARRVTVTHG